MTLTYMKALLRFVYKRLMCTQENLLVKCVMVSHASLAIMRIVLLSFFCVPLSVIWSAIDSEE